MNGSGPVGDFGAFRVNYDPDLPIAAHRAELIEAISAHQVVIVAGATGSGKSTQLPKLALEAGRGNKKMIAHTQPRRIAARSLAQRIADETQTTLGKEVGYAVRFDDRTHSDTVIKLMTDGVLLNELGRDKMLSRYDTIIVDEAHERSLNIDFLLGYLAHLVHARSDLHVIITSATIDTERFAQHFARPMTPSETAASTAAPQPAPVFEVEGRTYPVEIRYRPADEAQRAEAKPLDQPEAIANAVEELLHDTSGDILVFCSGEREIHDAADAVRQRIAATSGSTRRSPHNVEILELFARLSASDQHKVFAQHSTRRVIISTNIAETSLTVPGVRSVIDTGLARISRYSQRTKVQRLPIEEISQASANQRSGRCGRIGPGICIRLYSEENFNARPAFTDPEILRTNLAAVILAMANLNLGPPDKFGFIDPPDNRLVNDGINLLSELGAIAPSDRRTGDRPATDPAIGTRRWLTDIGKDLGRLPVDPRLGRMIIEARRRNVAESVIPIVARLAISDPRERPRDGDGGAAQASHKRFDVPGSDFLSILKLWHYLGETKRETSSSQFRRTCRKEHLHYIRVREWQDLVTQLSAEERDRTTTRGKRSQRPGGHHHSGRRNQSGVISASVRSTARATASGPGLNDEIHRSILAGLLSHIGLADPERGNFRAPRNGRYRIGRQSVLNRTKATWVMAAELIETDQTWGHLAAEIQPKWIEEVGEHLIRRTFTEPSWDPVGGSAVVRERSSILGLPLAADRRRQLSAIDFDMARSYFLDHGLVRSDWGIEFDVLDDNLATLARFEQRAAKARHVIEIDIDEALIAFYNEHVPQRIAGLATFRKWWRGDPTSHRETLTLSEAWLLDELRRTDESFDSDPAHFPDSWPHQPLAYPLEYVFAPGSTDDGVTVTIPVQDLHQLDPEVFRWHIPGYRPEMVAAVCRLLPKHIRRDLSPMSETIQAVLDHLDLDTAQPVGTVSGAIDGAMFELFGHRTDTAAIDWAALPAHLRLNFRVIHGDGVGSGGEPSTQTTGTQTTIAVGRDLAALTRDLDSVARASLAAQHEGIARTGATAWVFDDIPTSVGASDATGRPSPTASGAVAFPGLVDRGTHVDVVLHPTAAEREAAMWAGTRRLLVLQLPAPGKRLLDQLPKLHKLALMSAPYESVQRWADDCVEAAADELLALHGGPAWTESGFASLTAAVRADYAECVMRIGRESAALCTDWVALARRIESLPGQLTAPAVSDMRTQMRRLVYDGCLVGFGAFRITDVRRYLAAIDHRLSKLSNNIERDRGQMQRCQAVDSRIDAAVAVDVDPQAVETAMWMAEELRVSVFAQHLGTPEPISEQRIERVLTGG